MLVIGWSMVAQAGSACASPQVLEVPRQDAAGLAVQVDGELAVLAGGGDSVRVEVCGGIARLVRRDGTLAISAKHPVDSVTVTVPAGIAAVTVHQHVGAARIAVPAAVAVVSSDGPLEVEGASSLRVAWHRGDVVVDGLGGDLWVDRLTGSLDAHGVTGDAQVDQVSGTVAVDASGSLLVDGLARPDPQVRLP